MAAAEIPLSSAAAPRASAGVVAGQFARHLLAFWFPGNALLFLATGPHRWWVALLFMIPTTLLFHNFWAFEGAQQTAQRIHFMKNLAIMGGILYVMAFGAGPLSVDQRKR